MKKSKQFEVHIHGLGGPIHAFTVWAATRRLVLRELGKVTPLRVNKRPLYTADNSWTYATNVDGIRVTVTPN